MPVQHGRLVSGHHRRNASYSSWRDPCDPEILVRHQSAGAATQSSFPLPVSPPEPQLQVQPWEELPDLRAHEEKVLSSSGRDADGHLRIPINTAMDAVIPRLHLRPDTPSGITTPGGEGRRSQARECDARPLW